MSLQPNNFSKGIIRDLNPIKQPDNSYVDALNIVKLSDTGDYYSISNEKGTIEYCTLLPSDMQVIGRTVLEKDIILFFTNGTKSEIGIVDTDGLYSTMLYDANNELDLDVDHPIDCTARVLINTHRIVYFADNKNPVRTIDLDEPPVAGKIAKLSSLVPESIYAIVTDFNVVDSSSRLKCGAYQFAFRYLDDKGNTTSVSLPSPLVSIGQDSFNPSYNTGSYQGGYPDIDSNKSIVMDISNIDTDYLQLEIIAIYYKDFTNTLTTEVVSQINIQGNTSLQFTYNGQFVYSVPQEEVLGLNTNYSTAKCIEQKDGRLFISNLKETKDDSDLQAVANGIQLYYNIEQIDLDSGPSYKDPEMNAFKVGYKRGEVYSFAFGVVYKNGSKSFAFHIPAPFATGTQGEVVLPANTGTKLLGTYLSELDYPASYGPALTGGIRYHAMPTFEQEVPYDPSTNTINILGIKPVFTVDLPNDIKERIQGFYIVRRTRDSFENRSIYSQGIANYMMDVFNIASDDQEKNPASDSGIFTDPVSGNVYSYAYYLLGTQRSLCKAPLMGGIRLNNYLPYRINGNLGDAVLDIDYAIPTNSATTTGFGYGIQTTNQPLQHTFISSVAISSAKNGLPSASTDNLGWKQLAAANEGTPLSRLYKDLLVFYSTETFLEPKIGTNFTKIRSLGTTVFTKDSTVRFTKSEYDNLSPIGDFTPSNITKITSYWNYYKQTSFLSTVASAGLNVSTKTYIDRNVTATTNYGIDINNNNQEGFLLLQVDNNTLANNEETFQQLSIVNNDFFIPNLANDNDLPPLPCSKNIYEVYNENRTQYGQVTGQSYVNCKYFSFDIDNASKDSLTDFNNSLIYGGDTFINKVAFTNKVFIKSKPFRIRGAGLINQFWEYPENADPDNISNQYIDIRALMYFFVESDKNADLRHRLPGGNTFYPNADTNTVLKTKPSVIPDATAYNNQYDFENSLVTLATKPEIFDNQTTHYKTRTIWSNQAITGELKDTYREIAVNNFYDIPYNTGEIWDSFVYNNIFYLHTPKALWRTFVNSVEQQSNTVGQVVLGTGGVFPANLPPQQVLTQSGGYAGTISQWGGMNTPFGYIFPDSLQGKVFLLGEGLKEISLAKLTRFFNDNLSVLSNLYTNYIDNPFKAGGSGILSEYDYELKRFIMVKNSANNSFAISYDPIFDSFVSFHSYRPNILVSRDNDLYGIMNSSLGTLHQHNKGDYGTFYNQSSVESLIELVTNHSGPIAKVYDNLVINMDNYDGTNAIVYRPSGLDSILAYDDVQSSGVTTITWNNDYNYVPNRTSVRSQFINKQYNLVIPLNAAVLDNVNTINQNQSFRSRIKGNWLKLKLTFDNSNNLKFVINQIMTKFRVNIR